MSDGYLLQVKRNEENSLQKSAACRPKPAQLEHPLKWGNPLRYLGLPAGQYGRSDGQVVEVWEQADEEEHSAHVGLNSM